MKRIWFTQQAPFDYMPLRCGLGLITEEELSEYAVFNGCEVKESVLKMHQRACKSLMDIEYSPDLLCPKVFTTRTRPLRGEYVVVEGSRFKARPVEPRIEFRARKVAELILAGDGRLTDSCTDGLSYDEWKHFPEFDLGVRGASWHVLRDELLHLNKRATVDTVFYINRLERIK
jgi:hypothetical protein